MTSSKIDVGFDYPRTFFNKIFLFMFFWVVIAIAGLQYYIFHLEVKKNDFEQGLFVVDNILDKMDSSIFEFALFLNNNPNSALQNQRQKQYFSKIETLERDLTAALTRLEFVAGKGSKIDLSLPVFEERNLSNYRQEIIQVKNQLIALQKTLVSPPKNNLELLKRLLIAFGIFTSVFLLLALSLIKKKMASQHKLEKNTSDVEKFQKTISELDSDTEFYQKVYLYSSFQKMQEPCLILDKNRKVLFANQAFSALWEMQQASIAEILSAKGESSDELKKVFVKAFNDTENKSQKVLLGGAAYLLSDDAVWDGSSIIGYQLKLLSISDRLEFEALSKNIALMVQDVWDAPVRVLRENSPAATLAIQLDAIRLKIVGMFEEINGLSAASGFLQVKKIQQLLTLFRDIKAGSFDFSYDHNAVLELAKKADNELEQIPELELYEIDTLVEELIQQSEWILTKVESVSENNKIAASLQNIEDGLLDFSEDMLEKEKSSCDQLVQSVSMLSEALDQLDEAKQLTLKSISDDKKEEGLDLNQFFIDDVKGQFEKIVDLIEKTVLNKQAVLASFESNQLFFQDKIQVISSRLHGFSIENPDNEELLEKIRVMLTALQELNSKVKETVKNFDKEMIDVTDSSNVDNAAEDGDW